jgi:hypothetical protein
MICFSLRIEPAPDLLRLVVLDKISSNSSPCMWE